MTFIASDEVGAHCCELPIKPATIVTAERFPSQGSFLGRQLLLALLLLLAFAAHLVRGRVREGDGGLGPCVRAQLCMRRHISNRLKSARQRHCQLGPHRQAAGTSRGISCSRRRAGRVRRTRNYALVSHAA